MMIMMKEQAKVNRERDQEFVEAKEEMSNFEIAKNNFTMIVLWLGYHYRKLFVDFTQEDVDTHTPSPMAKFSSPSPPNAPSKTLSTKETSSTLVTTSSSFESKPHSSPSSFSSSRNTPFPQPTQSFLMTSLEVLLKKLQTLFHSISVSILTMNITLFLSPFTPLDHMFETPSPPPPPPPPQPPLMGHPIFFNILD
ncbi:hypothetical protein Tco_0546033 [Tanacetum coccineum]